MNTSRNLREGRWSSSRFPAQTNKRIRVAPSKRPAWIEIWDYKDPNNPKLTLRYRLEGKPINQLTITQAVGNLPNYPKSTEY